ncbi:hypothetical protein Golomagni_08088, partial [Golovinomyces magnicellulatus]
QQGGVSAVCVALLCDGNQPGRQRAGDARDHPSIRRGARSLLWKLRFAPTMQLGDALNTDAAHSSDSMWSLQILDELIIAGEMQESSKKSVLRTVSQSDAIEEAEQSEDVRSLCIVASVCAALANAKTDALPPCRLLYRFILAQSLARIGSRSG